MQEEAQAAKRAYLLKFERERRVLERQNVRHMSREEQSKLAELQTKKMVSSASSCSKDT
jgi:hypothetical protein